MTAELQGSILTPEGWVGGRVTFGGRVETIDGAPTDAPSAPFVLPGFVDLHVHGGGGADMMSGADEIRTAAALHLRHGTTSMLATSVTAPDDQTEAFLDAVCATMAADRPDMARVLGAHLEGPFINPDKLGAQPPFAVPADAACMRGWLDRARVLVVTFAPEMDPERELLNLLLSRGIRAQIGHSLCDYAEAAACIQAGCGLTHLFNAMSPVAHRGNGIAGAALAHADYVELIPDLLHVEPGAILAARRAIPNLYGVTDATAGAGMPDGAYRLGEHRVTKVNGGIRLDDGTLAGSALTMDQALRNLHAIGLPLDEAARRLSTIPADWLGMPEVGRIRQGCLSDFVVLDEGLTVQEVWLGGARQV